MTSRRLGTRYIFFSLFFLHLFYRAQGATAGTGGQRTRGKGLGDVDISWAIGKFIFILVLLHVTDEC